MASPFRGGPVSSRRLCYTECNPLAVEYFGNGQLEVRVFMKVVPLKRIMWWVMGMVFGLGHWAAGQALYNIVPIYAPPDSGALSVGALGMNDLGHVVGRYSRYDDTGTRNQIRAYIFEDGVGSIDAFPQAWTSLAEGINNRGQIAIYGGDNSDSTQAYRYTPGIGFEPLGSFGGAYSEVSDINNSGQVTGFSHTTEGQQVAFRYTDGVGLENLGTLSGGSSTGRGINDQGWVAGASAGHAFLFRDDLGMVDLGPGAAYGINNHGTVVGRGTLDGFNFGAFVYRDGILQLVTDTSFGNTYLFDINEHEVAVGNGLANGNQLRALIWSAADGLLDLNSLLPENSGWTLIAASGINELGQISGQGVLNGMPLAFRLDPVPEPSTLALLGLGGLAWWAWRKKQSR